MTTTPLSTISSPFVEEFVPLPPSPLHSLEERIMDTPAPLPLADCISEPDEEEVFQTPPPSPGESMLNNSPPGYEEEVPVPEGYSLYNPFITNHALYSHCIQIDGELYAPDAIRFDHNYVDHQHYVYATHRLGNPPMAPYGWPLEAVTYTGPALNPIVANNTDLTPFHANHTDRPLVDIGLYNVNDRGLTTDVNKLHGYEEDHIHLLEH